MTMEQYGHLLDKWGAALVGRVFPRSVAHLGRNYQGNVYYNDEKEKEDLR